MNRYRASTVQKERRTTTKKWSLVQSAINKLKQAYAICLPSKLVLWYLFVCCLFVCWIVCYFAVLSEQTNEQVSMLSGCVLLDSYRCSFCYCYLFALNWWFYDGEMFDCYYYARIPFNRIVCLIQFLVLLFAMCSHLLLHKTRSNCTDLCSQTIVCVVFACVDFFPYRLPCIDRNRASWRGENNVWIMFRAIVMIALNFNNDCIGPCSLSLSHSSRSRNVCAATNEKIRFHKENKSLHRYSLLHTIEWASNVKMFAFHWLCFVVIERGFFFLSSMFHRFFSHQFFSYFNRHFTVCISVYSPETYVVLWSPLKSSASGIESTSSPSHSQSYCWWSQFLSHLNAIYIDFGYLCTRRIK